MPRPAPAAAGAGLQLGRVKPDCMFRTSSITQVTHTSKAITPETAANRATPRSTTYRGLISFMGCRR